MKLLGEFTFLKLEKGQTKEDKKDYLIVSLLDDEMNSCRFFIFVNKQNEVLVKKLLEKTPNTYQKMNCVLSVSYYKDNWSVNLLDCDVMN